MSLNQTSPIDVAVAPPRPRLREVLADRLRPRDPRRSGPLARGETVPPPTSPLAVVPSHAVAHPPIKRAMDLTVSSLLAVAALPFLGVIAAMIKMDSPGEIFFVQTRPGLNGKPFNIYKFRTMRPDGPHPAEWDPHMREEFETYGKVDGDPRVTRVGRFLRRLSLDEMPQLFNVLRGEMALVGPRPLLHEQLDTVGHRLDQLVRVRPGLTGLWQVSGRNTLPLRRRVAMDLFYIRNWSPGLDLSILARTTRAVVSGRGAY